MAVLDMVLLAALGVSMLVGAWRGLVYELLSLVGWMVAFWLARWQAGAVAAWLPLQQWEAALRYALGFVLVFIVALFAWGLVSALARKMIEWVGLRPVDRVLGACFGALRAAVLAMVLAVVALYSGAHAAPWWQQSLVAPWLVGMVGHVVPALPQELGRYLPS